MQTTARDPLLLSAKATIYLLMGVMGLAAAALAIAAPAVLFMRGEVLPELGAGFPPRYFWLVPVAILAALAMVGLMLGFLDQLRRIIATVGDGDPFAPINADRLKRMGWLAVCFVVLELPLAMLGSFLERAVEAGASVSVEGDLNIEGLVLALVLFVLARVFRHGAAMRADLEGTI